MDDKRRKSRMGRTVRSYLLTGVLTLTPIVITLYVLVRFFQFVDSLLAPIYRRLPIFKIGEYTVPGPGFVTIILLLIVVGALATNLVGRRLFRFFEEVVSRIPFLNRMYAAIQQLSRAFLIENRTILKQPVLIEYPRPGLYSIAFVTSVACRYFEEKAGKCLVSVFLPTTPNPTSGFLLFVPEEQVVPLSMSTEDALKMVISGGIVIPEPLESRRPSPLMDSTEDLTEFVVNVTPGSPTWNARDKD